MAVIHSVAIVNWRLAYNSADAFICTDEIQSPIHVLLHEQTQHRSCPHSFTATLPPCLHQPHFPAVNCLPKTTQRQARACCVKVLQKKEQPLLILQYTQSKGLHHHPLSVKAIKRKAHVHPMKAHRRPRVIASLRQYSQNICRFYFVHDLF
jgi:hypothetical protein